MHGVSGDPLIRDWPFASLPSRGLSTFLDLVPIGRWIQSELLGFMHYGLRLSHPRSSCMRARDPADRYPRIRWFIDYGRLASCHAFRVPLHVVARGTVFRRVAWCLIDSPCDTDYRAWWPGWSQRPTDGATTVAMFLALCRGLRWRSWPRLMFRYGACDWYHSSCAPGGLITHHRSQLFTLLFSDPLLRLSVSHATAHVLETVAVACSTIMLRYALLHVEIPWCSVTCYCSCFSYLHVYQTA